MRSIVVCGAGGFIGGHLVGRLLREGHRVRAVDIKPLGEWYQRFEDAQNLAWKLDAVLTGTAPAALLETYAQEREFAADDNIGHSTRATDFISPKNAISRVFRNATLKLAKHAPFAQRMVNSGRLSTPSYYRETALSTPDEDMFGGAAKPGMPAPDAPLEDATGKPVWLLDSTLRGGRLGRYSFAGGDPYAIVRVSAGGVAVERRRPVRRVGACATGRHSGSASTRTVRSRPVLTARRCSSTHPSTSRSGRPGCGCSSQPASSPATCRPARRLRPD